MSPFWKTLTAPDFKVPCPDIPEYLAMLQQEEWFVGL
jgi:hypothetical protein